MQALIKIQASNKEVLNHAYSYFLLGHPSVHIHSNTVDSFCLSEGDMLKIDNYIKKYIDTYSYDSKKKLYTFDSLKSKSTFSVSNVKVEAQDNVMPFYKTFESKFIREDMTLEQYINTVRMFCGEHKFDWSFNEDTSVLKFWAEEDKAYRQPSEFPKEILYVFPKGAYQKLYGLFRGLKLDFNMDATSAKIAIKSNTEEEYYNFLNELSCQVEDTFRSEYPNVRAEPRSEFAYQVSLSSAIPKTKLKVLDYCNESRKWGLSVWANQQSVTFSTEDNTLQVDLDSFPNLLQSLSKALDCDVTQVDNILVLTEGKVDITEKQQIMLDCILCSLPEELVQDIAVLMQDINDMF